MKKNGEETYNVKEIKTREHFKINLHLAGLSAAKMSN